MENQTSNKSYVLGISLLVGMATLGYFIFKGLKTFSDKDRIVTVKGLAELNINANSSTIYISYSFSGDDLQELNQRTEQKKNAILSYLSSIGFSKNEIQSKSIDIEDKETYYINEWQNGKPVKTKIDRYRTNQMLVIETNQVKTTENKAAQIKLDLISKGLTSTISTNYSFPELNSVKPKLIAESTKNARVAGEQFANDSKAKLGKIKTASQGQITIVGRFQYTEDGGIDNSAPTEPYMQKARVVSTIVFFLE
ncbi:MAG: hypothetical protein RIS99_1123 [Bacteroidota bacterium]